MDTLVTVTVNREYQRGTGGNYFIKDTLGGRAKEIVFDVEFASNEDYVTGGFDLDLGRYFTKIIGASDLGFDQGVYGARPVIFAGTGSNEDHLFVAFEITQAQAAATSGQDAVETAIDGRTLKVRVLGY